MGPSSEIGWRTEAYFTFEANKPLSALRNRDSAFLVSISRRMAEYRVAAGVLPFGLDQYFLAAIASIIALVFIGSFDSASTWAAASRQESFIGVSAADFALAFRVLIGAASTGITSVGGDAVVSTVSAFGSSISYVVLPWQMYQLTKSTFAVAMISLAEFVPMFVMAFVGGALADFIDRRRQT